MSLAGLAWETDEARSELLVGFDIEEDSDIFAYDPFYSFDREDVALDIIPEYNAGGGDLASAPRSVTGVEEEESDMGTPTLRFQGAFPNPTASGSAIRFSLLDPTHLRVTMYDVAGREVRHVADQLFDAGLHEVAWDGRDGRGRVLPSGVYFYNIEGAGESVRGRITVVR